jgi:hypothetical protein
MYDKKGEKNMPAALREKPTINDRDAERISEVIRKNNELIEDRIKRLKAKLDSDGKRH